MSLEGAGSVFMNAAQKVCVIFISNHSEAVIGNRNE